MFFPLPSFLYFTACLCNASRSKYPESRCPACPITSYTFITIKPGIAHSISFNAQMPTQCSPICSQGAAHVGLSFRTDGLKFKLNLRAVLCCGSCDGGGCCCCLAGCTGDCAGNSYWSYPALPPYGLAP